MGKPFLILRTAVERNTEGLGWNAKVFENNFECIHQFINDYVGFIKSPVVPQVSPSEIIINKINQLQL